MKISALIVLCAVSTANAQCPCPCSPTPIPTVTPTATASSGLISAVAEWSIVHPGAPFVAMIGDSIMEGYSVSPPGFLSRMDGGPSGNFECDIATRLYETSGNIITGTNDGKSGASIAWIYGAARNRAILPPPKYLIMEGGINAGVAAGFASQQTWFDQAKSLCASHGSTLIVEEVWPSPLATNAQILAWNSALGIWASSNVVTLIPMHDWMADPTDRTKILAIWTTDHTHPTQAGVLRHSEALYNTLLQLEGQ